MTRKIKTRTESGRQRQIWRHVLSYIEEIWTQFDHYKSIGPSLQISKNNDLNEKRSRNAVKYSD